MMCKDPGALYRYAVYASLAAVTATLGWVLIHVGLSVPVI